MLSHIELLDYQRILDTLFEEEGLTLAEIKQTAYELQQNQTTPVTEQDIILHYNPIHFPYEPDCAYCLREGPRIHQQHTIQQHEESVVRARETVTDLQDPLQETDPWCEGYQDSY